MKVREEEIAWAESFSAMDDPIVNYGVILVTLRGAMYVVAGIILFILGASAGGPKIYGFFPMYGVPFVPIAVLLVAIGIFPSKSVNYDYLIYKGLLRAAEMLQMKLTRMSEEKKRQKIEKKYGKLKTIVSTDERKIISPKAEPIKKTKKPLISLKKPDLPKKGPTQDKEAPVEEKLGSAPKIVLEERARQLEALKNDDDLPLEWILGGGS